MLSKLNIFICLQCIGLCPIYRRYIDPFNSDNIKKYENENCKILNFHKNFENFDRKKGFQKKKEGEF